MMPSPPHSDDLHTADGRKLVEAYIATAHQDLLILLPAPGDEWTRMRRAIRPAARRETRVVVRTRPRRRAGPSGTPAGAAPELRVSPLLTAFLLVADRRVAVLGDERGQLRIVGSTEHIEELVAMFEQAWEQARPPLDADGDRLRAEILNRLAVGATDESVAKELGVSRRTVQRHVKKAMEELGVRSRFELGMRLASGEPAPG
ncbi:helix-turn-helix transcriptional regulator [Spirillospora sp. CA-294931]|uniref:helix-turn-helix transcriptional regulator n=1 Tax=Spirillospora sp. CA-294931 TaxID=3240042 RepID=UPI003D94AD87